MKERIQLYELKDYKDLPHREQDSNVYYFNKRAWRFTKKSQILDVQGGCPLEVESRSDGLHIRRITDYASWLDNKTTLKLLILLLMHFTVYQVRNLATLLWYGTVSGQLWADIKHTKGLRNIYKFCKKIYDKQPTKK